jgi:thiamine-monophosphate kinase
MNEFDLIERYFAPLAGPEGLNLKDDTARFTPKSGHDLLITTDSFVEGVHFPIGMYGANVAERLLRTNLSDIAAKAGTPLGYQLSVSIPSSEMEQWIPAFAKGLETTQAEYGCALWGGDMTAIKGPAVFSITLIGEVRKGEMVQRMRASLGDDIWLSGTLGDAMLGCDLALNQPILPAPKGEHIFAFEMAYWCPEPAFAYNDILTKFATAAADVSDGVMADVAHISKLSGTCATLNFDALPFSMGAESWAEAQKDPVQSRIALASFGDDYGIVFAAKAENRQAIFDAARKAKLKLTLIGSMLPGAGSICLDVDGQEIDWPHKGYRHT